jgi:hypothetical protein
VITARLDELELEEMRVPKFHKAPARV